MDYLPQIAQQGLLGVMLVVSLLANYFLYKENRNLQDKRVGDLIQTRDAYLSSLDNIKQSLELVLNLVQGRRKS